jgi:hypothetical protein
MIKWEYKRVYYNVDNDSEKKFDYGKSSLESLGEDGWELVSVIGNKYGQPSQFYFKRPIEEPL